MSTSYRSGILFGLVAYVWWGLVPLYFRQVSHVPAVDILAHRIVWSVVLVGLITAAVGGWGDLLRVLRSRKLVLTLLLSAVLLAGNWLLYIYATVTGRVSEASLGYYMMPLVNAFLATVFLGERLRPVHYPALGLVAVGVAIPFVRAGDFTWLAVAVPVTFAFYALVRKTVAVDSFTGLSVESLLMLGPSVGYLAWQAAHGAGNFGPHDPATSGWLALGGVVTVVPLLTFTISVRRMPLLANSFIQFVSPTIQLLIAVYWIGEAVSPDRWAAIVCVWAAVAIFVTDAVMQAQERRNPKNPSPGPSPHRGGEEDSTATAPAPPSLLGKGVGGFGSVTPVARTR